MKRTKVRTSNIRIRNVMVTMKNSQSLTLKTINSSFMYLNASLMEQEERTYSSLFVYSVSI